MLKNQLVGCPGDYLFEGTHWALWSVSMPETTWRSNILFVGNFNIGLWAHRCVSQVGWVWGPFSGHWLDDVITLNAGRFSVQWMRGVTHD